jgi:hypothetical protein
MTDILTPRRTTIWQTNGILSHFKQATLVHTLGIEGFFGEISHGKKEMKVR